MNDNLLIIINNKLNFEMSDYDDDSYARSSRDRRHSPNNDRDGSHRCKLKYLIKI